MLPGTEVSLTNNFSISGNNMEALAFAWMAFRTPSNLSGNLPLITGASREMLLGEIYLVLPLTDC